MQTILPGVFRLTGLVVGNVYLIEDPDGLTLIDASIAPSAGAILRQVARWGHPRSVLRRILITHAHPDHVGALPALHHQTDAQVIASAQERPVIEGRIAIPRVPVEKRRGLSRFLPPETILPGTPVHREVGEGDVLPEVLGGLQVLATPGHAPGHLAFWHPERRLLFCGDVIFRLPWLRLPFYFLTVDMEENKRSLRRLVNLDATTVCFGHGRPLQQDSAARLRAFARRVGAEAA
jgi:glyoxylase-like metal-dependent hydrolase (beta-lactamase superfamily II)